MDDTTARRSRELPAPDDGNDEDEASATWRVFVTLVTATALFFACFAALYDASIYWGPPPPVLGPKTTATP